MNINKIFDLYEENKMFEGKKIKFFKDPDEIKKHKYIEIMPREEEIIFGVKKNLAFHIVTDKAFYYECTNPNAENILDRIKLKRISLQKIFSCNIEYEQYLVINADKVDLGTPFSKTDNIFIQNINNIFLGILKNRNSLIENVKRTPIGAGLVKQVCQDYIMFRGVKIKHFVDSNKLNRYSSEVQNNEEIICVFKKNMDTYILTDKTFYFIDTRNKHRHIKYEDIKTCRSDFEKGQILINDLPIGLGVPVFKEDEKLIYAIESIINSLIALTTCYESLPQYSFGEAVTTSEYNFTKVFDGGLTEQEVLNAAKICRKAYENEELYEHSGFDPQLYDISICFDPYTYKQHAETFIDPIEGTTVLFKYESQNAGFCVSNKHLAVYKHGQQNTVHLLLPQVTNLTLENRSGKVYLTVNKLENFTIEIERQYANSCSLMLIALSALREGGKLESLLNLTGQFIRLRMLKRSDNIISTNNDIASNTRAKINAKFAFDLPTDRSFASWILNKQLINLYDEELVCVENNKLIAKTALSDVRIDFRHRVEGDPNAGYFTGAAFGLFGMAVGASIDTSRQSNLLYSNSEIRIGSQTKSLSGMHPNDAILLRFLIATLIILNPVDN